MGNRPKNLKNSARLWVDFLVASLLPIDLPFCLCHPRPQPTSFPSPPSCRSLATFWVCLLAVPFSPLSAFCPFLRLTFKFLSSLSPFSLCVFANHYYFLGTTSPTEIHEMSFCSSVVCQFLLTLFYVSYFIFFCF